MPRSYHGIKSLKKVYARDRERGETARFCLLLYLDLMQTQHFVHLAVQENDFEMRIRSWNCILRFRKPTALDMVPTTLK